MRQFKMSNMRTSVFIIILTFAVTATTGAQYYTGIDRWLITGPYSDQVDINIHSQAFIDESASAPEAEDAAGNTYWKGYGKNIIDFRDAGFSDRGEAAAYAFAYVYSGENQLARLLIGSDGGIKAWLNGIMVWDNPARSRLVVNENQINIQLSEGYNRLLLKVDYTDGPARLACNLLSSRPVKTGLEKPQYEELARSLKLAVVETSVSKIKGDQNVSLFIKAKNFGPVKAERIKCILYNSGGKKISEQVIHSMAPGITGAFEYSFPQKQAVEFFSKQGNQAVLISGTGKNSLALPSLLSYDLLMLLAQDETVMDAETKALARQVLFARDIYGVGTLSMAQNPRYGAYVFKRQLSGADPDPFIPAVKGLGYFAEGKYDSVASVLQLLYEETLKNIPDMTGDTIHVTGHAHMDMNWLWPYPESKKMFHDNFRQVVAFMDQFPDFTMLQSQATIFSHVEKMDPPLFEKIKVYVKENRLEPAGGMWTEGDCNMTGGEALVRSFLLGQRYFFDRFGRTAEVGWLPDNFGHISQYPQILKLSGCDYFYFMRCKPGLTGTFWWKGTDSTKVLCYTNDHYNGDIQPELKDDVNRFSPHSRRIFQSTGVGDHGGGPTLANINLVHKLDSTPHYPDIKFTTAGDFFKKSLNEMEGRPVHSGEMQFIFEGCYTSVAGIKENTRMSEQSLHKTEFLATLRWLSGEPYPAGDLKEMWKTVAFNQFHDILPGSAIYESNQDAVADHKKVQKESNEIFEADFRHLADEIAFKTGMGTPLVALNMQPHRKKTLVEAEVFTYEQPLTAALNHWKFSYGYSDVIPRNGNTATVLVRDDAGNFYPAQITGGKIQPPGYRWSVQFVEDNMPAGGYKTFYVDGTKPGVSDRIIEEKDGKFETDFFTIAFDMTTGDIIQLTDKRTGKEYVNTGGSLNKLRIYMEAPDGNAWRIGDIREIQDVVNVESVEITQQGPVRATVEAVKRWGHSKFIQRTYIYQSYPRIDFELEAHWFEIGDGMSNFPFLKTTFDLAVVEPLFYNHVPFDVLKRPVNGKEVPAQQWVDVTDGINGIALLNKTKFGHSFDNGQLRLSLLRATSNPDLYPNIGINHIHYSLFPHAGNWENGVWAEADNFNIPVYAAEPPSRALVKTHGNRPPEDSLLIVTPAEIVMSGIKQSEDGRNLIIRLAEVSGKGTVTTVTLPVDIKSAERVNLIEFPLQNADKPAVNGRTITLKIKPNEIVTICVSMND